MRPVVAWHMGWAIAMAVLATSVVLLRPALDAGVVIAALIAVLPGVGGLWLMARDGWAERALVLGGWSLAAVAAAALSGGMTGSLAGLAIMPFAAGIMLGELRLAQAGAVGTALAVLVGLVSVWLGGPAQADWVLAAAVALLSAGALATAITLTWGPRDRALGVVGDSLMRVETLLAAQPGLMLVLSPSGGVLAA